MQRRRRAVSGSRNSWAKLLEVLKNRSFVSLFMPCLILFTALGVAGALTLHANTFFWKLSAGQILLLTLVAPLGVFGGIFGASVLARRIEKRTIAMLGLAMIGVAQVGPVMLRLGGVIPASAAVPTLAVATVLGGLGGSIATIAFQSMMADATDEHEHLFGARREGLYFAGITFSAKASSGLGRLDWRHRARRDRLPARRQQPGASGPHSCRDDPQPRHRLWPGRLALHSRLRRRALDL